MNNFIKSNEQLQEELEQIKLENQSLKAIYEQSINRYKLVEQSLLKNEERYRKAQEVAHVGSWEYDIINSTFWGSDEGKRLYGFDLKTDNFTVDEVMNCVVDRKRVDKAMVDLIEKNEPYNIIFDIIPRNSTEIRTINSIAELIRDVNGNPLRVIGVLHDITKRRQMEEALEESTKKYRGLSEAAFEAIFISEKGICLEQNDAAEKMFGYTPEEAIGKPGIEWIALEDREMVLKNILSGYEEPYEATALRKDGTKFPCILHGKMTYYKGKAVRVTSLSDITERKLVETTLQKSEERFRAFLEGAPDAIFLADPDTGNILNANRAACRLINRPLEEIVRMNQKELHPPQNKKYAKDTFEQHVKEKHQTVPIENIVIRSDGTEIPVEILAELIEVSDQKVLMGTFRDITKRKQTEEALRDSEEQFKHLVRRMQVGVLLQGPCSEILLSNPKALELLGISEDQLLGKTSFDPDWNVIHEDGSPFPGATHPVPRAIETCQSVQNVIMGVYRPANKDRVWLLVNAEPLLKADGAILNVVCSFIDITKRKRAEEEIKLKNEELVRLNLEKDKLFSIIAHDLRSPFHGFIGLTEILALEADTISTAKLIRLGKEMHNSANNLFELLKNLLEWAQMQKGALDFEPEILLLPVTISKNIELIRTRSQQKGITIINLVSEPIEVFADEKMVSSILLNLISNAIKFTDKKGIVIINARTNEQNMIEISISDTGIGMPKTLEDKLFRIGEKIGQKGTDGELSTGLGLILCKEFVEKNGGKIWAESEERKGSTFYFTLCKSKDISANQVGSQA